MSRYRVAWIAIAVLVGGFEAFTLVNDVDGDTASAQVWALVAAYPLAKVAIAAGLVWLGFHWLRRPS